MWSLGVIPLTMLHPQDEYVQRAREMAGSIDHLASLRASLRPRLLASKLCRAVEFMRGLEDAYEGMWDAYWQRRGGPARQTAEGLAEDRAA